MTALFVSDADHLPRLTSITVQSEAGVTADALRGVSLRPLYDALGSSDPFGRQVAGIGEVEPSARPESVYAVWAARYLSACTSGSRRPLVDVAEAHGVSRRVVLRMVHRARERGLLLGGSAGKLGGRLSDRAIELLHE